MAFGHFLEQGMAVKFVLVLCKFLKYDRMGRLHDFPPNNLNWDL
jgi:hypothetical protein